MLMMIVRSRLVFSVRCLYRWLISGLKGRWIRWLIDSSMLIC